MDLGLGLSLRGSTEWGVLVGVGGWVSGARSGTGGAGLAPLGWVVGRGVLHLYLGLGVSTGWVGFVLGGPGWSKGAAITTGTPRGGLSRGSSTRLGGDCGPGLFLLIAGILG